MLSDNRHSTAWAQSNSRVKLQTLAVSTTSVQIVLQSIGAMCLRTREIVLGLGVS